MKKSALLLLITGLILSGCKTQQKATTENYDDVYYSKPKLAQSANKEPGSSQDLSAPKYVTSPDSSSSVKSGSASSKEDNSDYSYSSRLKRFHDPVGKLGYYDNYYTNNQNSDSASGNSSVNMYFGSSWGPSYWDPYFSMGWGFGGWGMGWDWGYPYSWYSPYYYWGMPCYYCGCYGWGSYPYWDYGYRNTFYGRRTGLSSGNGTGNRNMRTSQSSSVAGPARTNSKSPSLRDSRNSVKAPYSRNTEVSRATVGKATNINPAQRGTVNSNPQPVVKHTPADQQHYNYKRTNVQKNVASPRNVNKNTQGQRAVPRYVKPEYSTPARAGQAQIYSSPAYRQPKSSQEYISPRNQNIQNSGNNGQSRSAYSSPNNVRRYGGGNSTRSYSSPSVNTRGTYMGPTRSFSPNMSAPSRGGGAGYSAPSRSGGGGSYSAPARSGNSGGGSSGSGGGGGRRK